MKKELNTYLNYLTEEELRDEITMLVKRFPAVKDYYQLELTEDTSKILDKYKKQMRKSIFTGRRRMNRRARSASKQVIKDFKAVATLQKDVVELTFFRVGLMIEAAKKYRIENETFSNSILKDFEDACALAESEALLDFFREKAKELDWLHGECPAYYHSSFHRIYAQYFEAGS